jgi:predicted DNA-binding transcriptional regulator AlpA
VPCDSDNEHPDRILRIGEVLKLTGLSAATLWREVKAGRFPTPVPISTRGKGWLASEAYAWLAMRRTGS